MTVALSVRPSHLRPYVTSPTLLPDPAASRQARLRAFLALASRAAHRPPCNSRPPAISMILNENSGEPPASGADLGPPGRVWYTPDGPRSPARRRPLPARLLRLLDVKAWIALPQPNGRWKRLQAGYARLAPRQEVLELDRAWATKQGINVGAVTNDVRLALTVAPLQPPARVKTIARRRTAAADGLRCPDCGATGPMRGRAGRKFRNASDLDQHRKWCVHPNPTAEPIRCPDCGATAGKRGKKFRLPEDLLQHQKWCALRASEAAASGATEASQKGSDSNSWPATT